MQSPGQWVGWGKQSYEPWVTKVQLGVESALAVRPWKEGANEDTKKRAQQILQRDMPK